ncbi:MAG TPA: glycerophosphodiester phosphodiesterase family protein [Armatimonadota bacterium]|nr:glycerophosphodiester phosphodiesterase family protein [Armatimonadota bacterium]
MALVIAHRGDPAQAPENTVVSFRKAVALAVDMIELDVHLSRDGYPVIMHDFDVDRCTNGHGRIADMTLAELRTLDAGCWYAPAFAGERIPTLSEALEAIPAPVQVNMHLKPYEPENDRLERIALEHIDRFGLTGRLVIVHDRMESLERLRAMRPALNYCLLPPPGVDGRGYVDVARAHGLATLQAGREHMCADFIAYAHQHGIHVNVFYADSEEDMKQYLDWGVDGILSNCPARLQQVIRAR